MRQTRVTPLGELIADSARGLVYGNRGCLHDAAGRIRRGRLVEMWRGLHRTDEGADAIDARNAGRHPKSRVRPALTADVAANAGQAAGSRSRPALTGDSRPPSMAAVAGRR